MPYGELAGILQPQGWALHNMCSHPEISVIGAIATGTHGSGDANGNLATAVAAIELITAGGDLVEVRRGERDFDGIPVGLGAFGIVTHVTLDVQPTYDLQQDAFAGLTWRTALANLDAIMAAAYSVSVMTRWSGDAIERVWTESARRRRRAGAGGPCVSRAHDRIAPDRQR